MRPRLTATRTHRTQPPVTPASHLCTPRSSPTPTHTRTRSVRNFSTAPPPLPAARRFWLRPATTHGAAAAAGWDRSLPGPPGRGPSPGPTRGTRCRRARRSGGRCWWTRSRCGEGGWGGPWPCWGRVRMIRKRMGIGAVAICSVLAMRMTWAGNGEVYAPEVIGGELAVHDWPMVSACCRAPWRCARRCACGSAWVRPVLSCPGLPRRADIVPLACFPSRSAPACCWACGPRWAAWWRPMGPAKRQPAPLPKARAKEAALAATSKLRQRLSPLPDVPRTCLRPAAAAAVRREAAAEKPGRNQALRDPFKARARAALALGRGLGLVRRNQELQPGQSPRRMAGEALWRAAGGTCALSCR